MKTITHNITLSLLTLITLFALSFSNGATGMNAALASDSDDDSQQTTICHYPIGNPDNFQTMNIGTPAVLSAHLKHGDTYGACPCLCPAGVEACICADGASGIPSSLQPDQQSSSEDSFRTIQGK